MRIQYFDEIIAWQKAQDLAFEIYSIFGILKDFGFKDQICRATVSISNNTDEGFERGFNAEIARFFRIANGSCAEVRSMLFLALRLGYIDQKVQDSLIGNTIEVSKLIKVFIKSVKHNIHKPQAT